MFYMNMNGLMFIRIEIENKSKLFEYFWHIIVIVSQCKDTQYYLFGKINIKILANAENVLENSTIFLACNKIKFYALWEM